MALCKSLNQFTCMFNTKNILIVPKIKDFVSLVIGFLEKIENRRLLIADMQLMVEFIKTKFQNEYVFFLKKLGNTR